MFFSKEYRLSNFFDPIQLNYDLTHYFSLTWSRELEPKLLAPAKSFGSLWLQIRLHTTAWVICRTLMLAGVGGLCSRSLKL
jgi:hypothetical protein